MESKRVIDTIMNENEHRALDFDESESMSNDFGICKNFFLPRPPLLHLQPLNSLQ